MKKQIIFSLILTFIFLFGEAFAGNGMMNRGLVNTNLMPNIEIQHHQPDSSSMKSHPNMKNGTMKMQKAGSMGNMMMNRNENMKCDSVKRMKMMKMFNMNMKGMDSASRSMMMKKHMAMMMNGNKGMKCDSAIRMKMKQGEKMNMQMMNGKSKMHYDSAKHK